MNGGACAAGTLCVTLALGALASLPVRAAADPLVVRTDAGAVRGQRLEGGVRAFLGIPYAAPPVGERRWREVQEPQRWQGVRDATRYASSCFQVTRPEAAGLMPGPSEDCLYLNVWIPPASQSRRARPVLVYVHGAGFNVGSASVPMLSGEFLARRGLIVVSMNYRLGAFANLALPELTAESPHHTSGALMHLDQLAALRWVQQNIARFGGDPRNVTLAGQSSGSINVCALQASPLARGLFARIVGMSGACVTRGGAWPARTLADAERDGLALQARLGANKLAELRAIPAESILMAAGFSVPVGVDGYLLPRPPGEIFAAGEHNDLPTLVGDTRDEGFSGVTAASSVGDYEARVRVIAGDHADEVLALFPAHTTVEVPVVASRLANQGEFGKQMLVWARRQAARGRSPAYLYEFDGAGHAAVPHGMDVAYWFGTLDAAMPRAADKTPAPIASADRELSANMMEILVSFASGGFPRISGKPLPRLRRGAEQLVRLGVPVKFTAVPAGSDYFARHPEIVVGIGETGGVAGPPAAAPRQDRAQ